jgi:capsular exopolysaccharide synthesis family protein
MGRRVLLVDADLRRPQMHTKLGLSNELGLSNVISTNLPVLDAIQRSPSTDDLFVLTSGQSPPDPIKLLSSKKMQNLMHQLRQEFDLVIYDTPPLVGFADGSLLGTYTNGIMLVVRMDKTDISAVKQALDGLKLSRATILGMVSNCSRKYNTSAYNYYYRTPAQNIG